MNGELVEPDLFGLVMIEVFFGDVMEHWWVGFLRLLS